MDSPAGKGNGKYPLKQMTEEELAEVNTLREKALVRSGTTAKEPKG